MMQAPEAVNGAANHWDLAVPLSQENALPPQKNTSQHGMLSLKSSSKPPLTLSKDQSLNRRPSRDAEVTTLKSNGALSAEPLQPHRIDDLRSNGISRTGSEADSLLDLYRHTPSRGNSSTDVGENKMRHDSHYSGTNEEHDDEKWIHRDKLAKIESEELQAAGIKLATTSRTSSKTRTRRAPSIDRQSDGTNGNDQDSWPAMREEKRQRISSPVEEEREEEQQDWDLRSPAEIAAETPEETNNAKVYQNSVFKKSKSKIPVLTAGPIAMQDKDTPRPRIRATSGPQADDEQPSQSKTHSRKGSAASQTLLNDIGSGTAAPKSPTTAPSENRNEGSPSKRKVTPKAPPSSSTSTPGSRKVTPSSRKVSSARPRSGSSSSPAQRPSTRAGDDRPRTAVNRPEGDPPWLATMYKPDPMLPPDQQIIPTHAKRQQQAQWAQDGSIPKIYDRNFTPLAIHTNDGLKPSSPPKNSSPIHSPEQAQQSWPMKEISRAPSNGSRPGTSGTDRGGYSTMPKVTTSPAIGSMSSPRLSPRPSVPGLQTDAMQSQKVTKVTKLPDSPEPQKKEKGCWCCLVM